jgi:hypothetical protein
MMKISNKGGCERVERSPADAYKALAKRISSRLNRRAVVIRWWVLPDFEVLRKTPSFRAEPSMHARAVIQPAERLMTRHIKARRYDMVVQ